MTNELEEQFFEAFKIEKPCTRERDVLCMTFRPDGKYRATNGCLDCEYLGDYPEITDHHYLELLEILLNFEYIGLKKGKDHYSIDFQGWLEQREKSLRDAILKSLIVVANSEFKDVVYNDVRTLFEEG